MWSSTPRADAGPMPGISCITRNPAMPSRGFSTKRSNARMSLICAASRNFPHGEYRRSYSHRLPSDSDRLICRSSKLSPRVTTCIMLSAITSGERVLIATGLRTLLDCPLGAVCRRQAHVRSSKPDIRMPVPTSPRVMLPAVAFRHCYRIAVNSFTVNGLDHVADPFVVHSKEFLKPP